MLGKKRKKLFGYENTEGDKGIIIATSMKEAIKLFHEIYPEREIKDLDDGLYCQNDSYLFEVDALGRRSKLYCAFPW